MKNKIIWIVIFFLGGCSSNSVFVNADYINNDLSTRQLTILPIVADSVFMSNIREFDVDSLSGLRIIRDSLYSLLLNKQQNYVYNILLDKTKISSSLFDNEDSSLYFTFQKVLGAQGYEKLISFKIPKKEKLISLDIPTDIVLIIEKIHFERDFDKEFGNEDVYIPGTVGVGGIFSRPGGDLGRDANSTVKYIIWDYKLEVELKCGIENLWLDFSFPMKYSTWEKSTKILITRMIHKSPLSKYW